MVISKQEVNKCTNGILRARQMIYYSAKEKGNLAYLAGSKNKIWLTLQDKKKKSWIFIRTCYSIALIPFTSQTTDNRLTLSETSPANVPNDLQTQTPSKHLSVASSWNSLLIWRHSFSPLLDNLGSFASASSTPLGSSHLLTVVFQMPYLWSPNRAVVLPPPNTSPRRGDHSPWTGPILVPLLSVWFCWVSSCAPLCLSKTYSSWRSNSSVKLFLSHLLGFSQSFPCLYSLICFAAGEEIVTSYYQLHGRESEQTPGDDERQGSLACCLP